MDAKWGGKVSFLIKFPWHIGTNISISCNLEVTLPSIKLISNVSTTRRLNHFPGPSVDINIILDAERFKTSLKLHFCLPSHRRPFPFLVISFEILVGFCFSSEWGYSYGKDTAFCLKF